MYIYFFISIILNEFNATKRLYINHKKPSSLKVKTTTYKTKRPFKNVATFIENLNKKPYIERGLCSYYHNMFHGRTTSNGDIFDNNKWTCAHKTLPMPSIILVTFLYKNKIRGVKLLVNDRGPFIKDRIVDVSNKVAKEIGILDKGVIKVVIFLLKKETLIMFKTGAFTPIERILDVEDINKILKENNSKVI